MSASKLQFQQENLPLLDLTIYSCLDFRHSEIMMVSLASNIAVESYLKRSGQIVQPDEY